MSSVTKREKLIKESLYQIGYEYLRNNFHKFNQTNKIRVAVEILKIFEKDDSKTPQTPITVTVEIQSLENKTTPIAGNCISEYLEV